MSAVTPEVLPATLEMSGVKDRVLWTVCGVETFVEAKR